MNRKLKRFASFPEEWIEKLKKISMKKIIKLFEIKIKQISICKNVNFNDKEFKVCFAFFLVKQI